MRVVTTIPSSSTDAVGQGSLASAEAPAEATPFGEIVQKTRDLLGPTFPLRRTSEGIREFSVPSLVPRPSLTREQRDFIAFLFGDRCQDILEQRAADVTLALDKIRSKTPAGTVSPESENDLQKFVNSSRRDLLYVKIMRNNITERYCAPPEVYPEDINDNDGYYLVMDYDMPYLLADDRMWG
ncbi:uncharacterized protein B0T15DRAFT_497160 [Chaetomium strumarium]|uniref:Uncharacterized protein n=1 Tax=Chaetomium strumarium TaxID=1170767 RepID=A0AAJ0GMI1_9PEZI|nr:hypothetical protein B0T15DRAFT_497160 [Chaetomium strumarium]